jgi:hypothetical protein
MKRKFKQWWSIISPISTKWTVTSHLSWTHWTQKSPWHMTLEIQVLVLDRHKYVTGFKQFNGQHFHKYQPSTLTRWTQKKDHNICHEVRNQCPDLLYAQIYGLVLFWHFSSLTFCWYYFWLRINAIYFAVIQSRHVVLLFIVNNLLLFYSDTKPSCGITIYS